ncbi:hypothetical protein M8J75_006921 [Diaphorina citri]|nr:hypothetical protein M8J75_006921 [Diaphorina citri]
MRCKTPHTFEKLPINEENREHVPGFVLSSESNNKQKEEHKDKAAPQGKFSGIYNILSSWILLEQRDILHNVRWSHVTTCTDLSEHRDIRDNVHTRVAPGVNKSCSESEQELLRE